jgi:hypothetical protein
MSLLGMIRNHFSPDQDDDSVAASNAAIEESKQARMQMNEQARQAQHDAFQASVEQEHIRSNILNQILVRKAGTDFLDKAMTNQEGDRGR